MAEPVSPRLGPALSPAAGVEIVGVDLSQPLSRVSRELILAALRRHRVAVFREQQLSREEQFAFACNFGAVEHHAARGAANKRYAVAHIIANLDADGRPSAKSATGANYRWHTDKPYRSAPPWLTMLHAVELPPAGGDTEFANTAQAYAALPEATRSRLAGMRVVFRSQYAPEQPAVDHPLVRTHPQTGDKGLYLGNHALYILGRPEAEGRALLDELLAYATRPQFVYAHRWQPGDLVMWDNCVLLHRAVANYEMTRWRRIMHRSVIKGTVPF
jgi:alpha-ketoglutarate-dependent taurine dioxygenase